MRLTLQHAEKLIITNVPTHPTIVSCDPGKIVTVQSDGAFPRGKEFDFPEDEELDEPTEETKNDAEGKC